MHLNPNAPEPDAVEHAAEVIRQGGIVLHPTDTIYGLGCDPFNERALQRLFEVKGRPRQKGVLVLVPTLEWVAKFCAEVPHQFHLLARRFWPGPITFLLPGRADLPSLLLGSQGQIGLRCPKQAFLQQWMSALSGPVVSTSANLSGEPPPKTVKRLKEIFSDRVDLLLEAGELNQSPIPSTVADLTSRPPKIVRRGALAEELAGFLDSGSE